MELFKPAFGLGNCHIQTIYSSLFRKEKNILFDNKRFQLSDGDFLECYWHKTEKRDSNTPIVILFHGLAGSYKSPYIQGAVTKLSENGFDSVLMHFRGCTGKDNLLPRSYHSGESGDALEFITSVKEAYPNRSIYAVGYSLGANMLLKLLGELKKNTLIEKAIAISPPMQLDACSSRMNRGFSRYYQHRLIKDLNSALDRKYEKHDMQKIIGLKREDIKNLKTFMDFDSAYTAPVHNFSSAQEYYKKSSSKQYLKDIQTPTLIIHSSDDPFMTKDVIPNKKELSDFIELKLTQKGGHVGFIGGTIFKPHYWLEKQIVRYFSN